MKLSSALYPLLVVLLAVFAVAPLQYPGAFQSHTGLLASYNLIDLDHQASPLQFFAWAPTVGHAYDLFRTDGVLPFVVAEIFHLLGLNYLDSVKLVYALASIASGLAMYALARRWLREPGALLASVVYMYLPYHLATVYVRGAFGEAVAWALFPLALLTADGRPETRDRGPVIPGLWSLVSGLAPALPFALLYLAQPGLAILFALVTLAVVSALNRGAIRGSLLFTDPALSSGAAVGGLLVGALLSLPSILAHGAFLARDGFQPSYVLPFQLFSSLWGYGPSTGNYLDQFPLQLGVVPVGLALVAAALTWRGGVRLNAPIRRILVVFLCAAVIIVLLTFEIAAPVWSILRLFAIYPWQLLAFAGLALALVAGTVVELDPRFARTAMAAVFVALPIVASYGYLTPRRLDFTPARPQVAIFGDDEIALLDYRIVGPLRHGATVRVQMLWQALRPVDHDYTVFVHAINADDGKTYAAEDTKPLDGALPTIKWTPGQVISDTHTIQIDVEGPREGYHLEVGLYQAATGARALTETGADQLILPRPGDPEPTITDQVLPISTKN